MTEAWATQGYLPTLSDMTNGLTGELSEAISCHGIGLWQRRLVPKGHVLAF